MWSRILSINVFATSTLFPLYLISVVLIVLLIIRIPRLDRPRAKNIGRTPGLSRWLLLATVGLLVGAALGLLVLWLTLVVFDVFGPVTPETWWWGLALFAGFGLAVVNLWRTRIWRKVIAVLTVPALILSAAVGINFSFGLNSTVAAMFGLSSEPPLQLAKPHDIGGADPKRPLWESWMPPADMPAIGKTGTAVIPATKSHFNARPAGIYLPPAALTAHPPKLPLYIMMMGQPGRPDPQYVAGIFDDFARKHHGLAPIVVLADQVGPGQADTLCLNTSKFGNVEDYVAEDVVSWAKQNLNVLSERKYWTIAGYSNGGQCAISFGAKHPNIWGNIVDISGEEFPGAEHPDDNLASIFNGNQAAYDAQKPVNIMAKHHYQDTSALFTVGSNDSVYVPQAKRVSLAAKAAGMKVTYHEIPNGGHLIKAINGGLTMSLAVFARRWGLAK